MSISLLTFHSLATSKSTTIAIGKTIQPDELYKLCKNILNEKIEPTTWLVYKNKKYTFQQVGRLLEEVVEKNVYIDDREKQDDDQDDDEDLEDKDEDYDEDIKYEDEDIEYDEIEGEVMNDLYIEGNSIHKQNIEDEEEEESDGYIEHFVEDIEYDDQDGYEINDLYIEGNSIKKQLEDSDEDIEHHVEDIQYDVQDGYVINDLYVEGNSIKKKVNKDNKFHSSLIEVSSEQHLDKLVELSQDHLLLLMYYSDDSEPCEQIMPCFIDYCDSNSDLIYGRLNLNDLPQCGLNANIHAVPTFHLYFAGKNIAEIVGPNEAELKLFLSKLNSNKSQYVIKQELEYQSSTPKSLIEISSQKHLKLLIESSKESLLMVMYYSDDSEPCADLTPVYVDFCETNSNLVYSRINLSNLPSCGLSADIVAVPTFHVYFAGQNLAEIVGPNGDELETFLSQFIKVKEKYSTRGVQKEFKSDKISASSDFDYNFLIQLISQLTSVDPPFFSNEEASNLKTQISSPNQNIIQVCVVYKITKDIKTLLYWLKKLAVEEFEENITFFLKLLFTNKFISELTFRTLMEFSALESFENCDLYWSLQDSYLLFLNDSDLISCVEHFIKVFKCIDEVKLVDEDYLLQSTQHQVVKQLATSFLIKRNYYEMLKSLIDHKHAPLQAAFSAFQYNHNLLELCDSLLLIADIESGKLNSLTNLSADKSRVANSNALIDAAQEKISSLYVDLLISLCLKMGISQLDISILCAFLLDSHTTLWSCLESYLENTNETEAFATINNCLESIYNTRESKLLDLIILRYACGESKIIGNKTKVIIDAYEESNAIINASLEIFKGDKFLSPLLDTFEEVFRMKYINDEYTESDVETKEPDTDAHSNTDITDSNFMSDNNIIGASETVVYEGENSDHDLTASEDEINRSEDEVVASEEEVSASEDEVNASEDEVNASEDEVNKSEDEVYASEDEINASEDEINASDIEVFIRSDIDSSSDIN